MWLRSDLRRAQGLACVTETLNRCSDSKWENGVNCLKSVCERDRRDRRLVRQMRRQNQTINRSHSRWLVLKIMLYFWQNVEHSKEVQGRLVNSRDDSEMLFVKIHFHEKKKKTTSGDIVVWCSAVQIVIIKTSFHPIHSFFLKCLFQLQKLTCTFKT